METIKILLADDHKVLRDGLRALLEGEGDLTVVAEAGTANEAVDLTSQMAVDVVVMDLGMPGGGLNAIRTIRGSGSPVRIAVLSMHSGREIVTMKRALIPPKENPKLWISMQ